MGMSALLAETTRLLTMFQDKEKGINASVAAAIAAVPEMSKELYVNAITGDDVTGTGVFSKPFKTIAKAVKAIPYGGGGSIKLFGHEHVLGNITVSFKNITISTASGETVKPTLRNVCLPASNGTLDNRTTGFLMDSATIVLSGIRVRTADYVVLGAAANDIYTGLFRRNDRPMGMYHLTNCEIELGDTPLARHTINSQIGIASLYLNKVSRVGPVVLNTALVELAGAPMIFASNGNTLPAGGKWLGDYLTGVVQDSNGAVRSVITNLILA